MKFTKMQGIGNDYVYVNCFEETVNDPEKLAEATPSQITTALGTLIDKWAMMQEKTGGNSDDGVTVVIDV